MNEKKQGKTIIASVDDSPIYNTLKEHHKRDEEFNKALMGYLEEYNEYIDTTGNPVNFVEWLELNNKGKEWFINPNSKK